MLGSFKRLYFTTVQISQTLPPRLRLQLHSIIGEFTLTSTKILHQLAEEITNQDPKVKKVEFKDIEGNEISDNTHLNQLIQKRFILTINSQDINVLPAFQHMTASRSHYLSLCQEMGVSLNNARQISRLLEQIDSKLNEDFTPEELHQRLSDAMEFVNNSKEQDIKTLEDQKRALEQELQPLQDALLELRAKSERNADRVVKSGLGVLLFQWGGVAYGTFLQYGWDVMEPFTYMVGMSWSLLGFIFFMRHKEEFQVKSYREMLIEAKYNKLVKKHKIDLSKIELLRKNIVMIEQQLKILNY